MKIIFILFFSISIIFANIAKITGIKGDVQVQRDNSNIIGKIGLILKQNDKIFTDQNSKVLILFKDNTSITVGKNSTLAINDFILNTQSPKNSKANFGFGKGMFRTITGQIGKLNPKAFKIQTRSATIGIRGSDGTTIVNIDGSVKHVTNSGAFIMTDNATGLSVDIPKGSTGILSPILGISVADTSTQDLEDTKELSGDNKGLKDKPTKKEDKEKKEKVKDKKNKKENDKKNKPKDDKKKDNPKGDKPPKNNPNDPNKPPKPPHNPENTNEFNPEANDPNPTTNVNPLNIDPNNIPTQTNQNQSTNQNPTIVINSNDKVYEDKENILSVGAMDNDNDPLTFTIVNEPKNGTVRMNEQGRLVYTPNANYTGEESITIQVNDGRGGSDTKTIYFNVINVNDNPSISLSSSKLTTNSNGTSSINYTLSDQEENSDKLNIQASANKGLVTIENGVLVYQPEVNYNGNDTITLTITDSNGGVTIKTINVVVNSATQLITYSKTGVSSIATDITQITRDIIGTDTYNNIKVLEYGFIKESGNFESTYVTGISTPTQLIDKYITNNVTAKYEGGVAAFVNGTESQGKVILNMDFGNQTLDGSIEVTQNNIKVNIASGTDSTINSSGFTSTNITSDASSGISGLSGQIDGKFYGPTAGSVGGKFSLSDSSTNSVHGVFGANKK